MGKVVIKPLTRVKKQLKRLTVKDSKTVDHIVDLLTDNPFKSDWDRKFKYEKLKNTTYKGLSIYSLRINQKDRFCYSIDKDGDIIILIISVKSHYARITEALVINHTLAELKAMCINKQQKIAFNHLLNTLKFPIEKFKG